MLEELGIDYNRFAQVMARKQALRAKELIQIAGEFPEYEYWILTGKEMPALEHRNPMSEEDKKRREDKKWKKQRKAALESFKQTGILSRYEERELELLVEDKLSYDDLEAVIKEMKREDDKVKYPQYPS